MSLYQFFSELYKNFVFDKGRSVKLMIKILLGITPLRICKIRKIKEEDS